MKPSTLAPIVLFALLLPSLQLGGGTDAAAQGRAKPRETDQPEQREPSRAGEDQRAKPRPPSAPPERQPAPRHPAPPPRVVVRPPSPRVYIFPPLSRDRGFYYHPRFLFYYGPYYGPLHEWPRGWTQRYSMSSVRLRVKPADTEVYLNGYFAGRVDDFDGMFQRLYVPAGEHLLELYLEGYRTFRRPIYFSAGDAPDVVHQMLPLRPGETSEPPSRPRPLPEGWTDAQPSTGDRPDSPFGIVTIRIDTPDAELRIDDERWQTAEGKTDLVTHLEAGWHRIEVRRPGYQTFATEIEVTEGQRTGLKVTLTPAP
jgi:hypothetical protein